MPVNVIMIVLQIGPTYQTCIYFAEKRMVLRRYDHNLNTYRKRRLYFPDYIFLWHSKPAPDDRWASSKALQLARVRCNCLPQQHAQLRRLLLSFPKRKLRRQVCTNCVIHETYNVSQRLTNLCFVPNPICYSPTGGRPTVMMPAPHLSFI